MAIPPNIQKLLDGMAVEVQKAILQSVQNIKSRARMTLLVAAIENGRVDEVIRVLNLGDEFFEPIDEAMRSAYLAGGRDAITAASRGFPRADRLGIVFSVRSPEAEAWIKENSSRLITEIASSTREAVRGVLTNGLVEGRNPRSVAIDLIGRLDRATNLRSGGVVGLNSHLTGYFESARNELSSTDANLLRNYLSRQLRDKRYDAVVMKAIASGRGIPVASQARMLNEYSDGLLQFRAKMIARTEATEALNASRHEAVGQLVRGGRVAEEDVQRRWRAAGDDGRTRDTHLDMDNQLVSGLKEPFTSPSGARLMYPGDTSLGAGGNETIQCRCYEQIEIDYIAAQARAERNRG